MPFKTASVTRFRPKVGEGQIATSPMLGSERCLNQVAVMQHMFGPSGHPKSVRKSFLQLWQDEWIRILYLRAAFFWGCSSWGFLPHSLPTHVLFWHFCFAMLMSVKLPSRHCRGLTYSGRWHLYPNTHRWEEPPLIRGRPRHIWSYAWSPFECAFEGH